MTPFELTIVLLSAGLHAIWNAYAKGTRNPMGFLALLGVACLVPGLPLLPWMPLAAISTEAWWLIGASSVAHFAYQVFLSQAYLRGDLSVVYPIARSTPAFVAIIAVPLLGDEVSLAGGAGIGVVVFGMWLVHTRGRLRWSALVAPGAGFAYLTLAATVVYSILDKEVMVRFRGLGGDLPPALVYFFILQATHGVLFVSYAVTQVPGAELRAIMRERGRHLVVGSFACISSYVLILHALETASVSYVTAVRQSSVLFAAIIGIVTLGERPGRARIIGTAAIVAGVAMIALYP